MPCYKPWIGIPKLRRTWLQDGVTMALRADDNRLQLLPYVEGENFLEPFAIDAQSGEALYKYKIPCGNCVGCRLDYSRDWAARCSLEQLALQDKVGKNHVNELSWFITLTYDDEHLPLEDMYGNATLNYKHLQDFWKRLRRHAEYHGLGDNIRYYAAGEYGEKYSRPHFHAVVFGLCIPDLKPWSKNELGDQLYISDMISDLWGHGFITIGEFSWKTGAYVARYVMKKYKGKETIWYDAKNVEYEKALMSRRPGLAFDYFQDHADEIYVHDKIQLVDGQKITPPKYFDSLYAEVNPKRLSEVKQARSERAIDKENARLIQSNYSEIAYFTVQENKKKSEISSLRRIL